MKKYLEKIKPTYIVFALFCFAIIIKYLVGAFYYNEMDTFWYLDWAKGLQNGFFNAYSQLKSLDYPPMYLYPLFLIGAIYKIEFIANNKQLLMLLLKFFPILFDILCGLLIFKIVSKKSLKLALLFSTFWLFNPSIFFNSSFWGQTDSIMMFLLILSFYLIEQKKPYLATIFFTIAVFTKFQVLFFAPIFLLEIFRFDFKKIIKSVVTAIVTFIVIFAPFMLFSGPFLPIKIYTRGFDAYQYINLNSFNFYGLFELNWEKDSLNILPFLSYHNLSLIITLISVLFIVFLYIKLENPSIWLTSFILMQIIFMFSTRMHERYQIIVVPLILMAYFRFLDKRLLMVFISTSVITFFNQALLLIKANYFSEQWEPIWNSVLFYFSILNVIIFIFSMVVCLNILFKKKEMENSIEQE